MEVEVEAIKGPDSFNAQCKKCSKILLENAGMLYWCVQTEIKHWMKWQETMDSAGGYWDEGEYDEMKPLAENRDGWRAESILSSNWWLWKKRIHHLKYFYTKSS